MHLTQFRGYTVLVFLLFFLLMLLLHGKFLPQPGWQMILMIGYAALLSAMSAMAVTAAVQLGSPAGYLTAAGGICFYISDNILGFPPAARNEIPCFERSASDAVLFGGISDCSRNVFSVSSRRKREVLTAKEKAAGKKRKPPAKRTPPWS